MAVNLKGRSLLTLKDYSYDEIRYLLDVAHRVKRERASGIVSRRLAGMNLAMLFEKRSTRTRCAFETAFAEEGGHPVFLSTQDIHLGKKESIEDTARVLGRMFDAIIFRGFEQDTVQKLAEYSGVPVYNGLTDLYHPTQILADLLTIEETFGELKGKTLVYLGDGRNNVAHSLLVGCAKMGLNCTIATHESLMPAKDDLVYCQKIAQNWGATLTVSCDTVEAVKGADVIYTDVWVSLGEETKSEERLELLRPYQVNEKMMSLTGKGQTIFLHCLPAVKGNEVTAEVIEGPQSRVWDEAENRKHTIKSLLLATLKPEVL
ncbi:MAG TPA: ornithine carbamoyltransferase [Spirochaetia bacterium]|nr:ornithine carbamoyltransferase [Spirochaetia bacterium]